MKVGHLAVAKMSLAQNYLTMKNRQIISSIYKYVYTEKQIEREFQKKHHIEVNINEMVKSRMRA